MQASGTYGLFDYNYDSVGNRLGLVADTFNETYAYPLDSHRLQTVSSTGSGGQNKNLVYSDAGHVTDDGQYTYQYNHRNRLIQVSQGGSPVADYLHNALGQRIIKTVNGESTHFNYGLDNLLIAESQGDGTPTRDYIYFNGQQPKGTGTPKT